MKQSCLFVLTIVLLAGCGSAPRHAQEAHQAAQDALLAPDPGRQAAALPEEVSAALLPPLRIRSPQALMPAEERFSVSVVKLPARDLFMALAADSRYTMLVHPDVSGNVTAELKNVTMAEALESLQQILDFDYEIKGARVVVKPSGLRSRVFQVNYLLGSREGRSSTRVTSGSISAAGVPGRGTTGNAAPIAPAVGGAAAQRTSQITTSVETSSESDFWSELKASLEALVGAGQGGRNVVINPQSGVVMVRAMTQELDQVASFLRATRMAIDRQVIIEAKIVEVQLNGQFQSGVNWAAFNSARNTSLGFGQPGTSLGISGQSMSSNQLGGDPGTSLDFKNVSGAVGSLFGLAVQTSNFSALISFLETQGTVHVLSSPRIATLNNQKAVLKVGKEDFFVTDVKPGSVTASATAVTTPPAVTLQPFFSGVVLDVTPQIGEDGYVMLHVRPSVSAVTTVDLTVDLGQKDTAPMILPLASSSASETDSVIRARDGQLVVIGGLMRQAATGDRSQLPGAGDVPLLGSLFRNTNDVTQKRELVILLRPLVINSDADWNEDLERTGERLRQLRPPERRSGLR